MRIHHHQHHIVDFLIAKLPNGGLDIMGDPGKLAMRASGQIAKCLRRAMCQQDERAQCRLPGPRLHAPPAIIRNQGVLTAETGKSSVSFWYFAAFHGYSPI